MPEIEESQSLELKDYWGAIARHRWAVIATIFICWSLAWVASWILPPRYRSETLILVEQQKVPQQYVASNVAMDFQQQLQTMSERILSRARLLRIIDDFHLYQGRGQRLSPDEMVDLMRKDIEVQQEETQNHKQLTAFHVDYSSSKPALAQQVASRLTSLFIQENLLAQQQQSESTTQFLAASLDQARQVLTTQEEKIRVFKAQYLGELPSQAQSNMQILSGLQARADHLTAQLSRSQEQRLYLESLLTQYHAVDVSVAPAPEDPELVRLRAELAEARTRYTESNSYVKSLKAQIEAAEKRKPQSTAKPGESAKVVTSADMAAMTPMMQVQSQLKANEQEIKNTEAQLKDTDAQIRAYQVKLNSAPIHEQQLAVLMRDYDQLKANYDSLLKKQMDSQLATNMENRQEGAQFVILDAPSLPAKPYSPNRIKFSLGGLGAGIFFGIVIAIAWELISNKIRRERDVVHLMSCKVPENVELISPLVMVGIPHMSAPQDKQQRARRLRLEWAVGAVVCLIIVAGNVISITRG